MRAALLALLSLAGCVPSLHGWRVVGEGEDAGPPPPSRDAGPPLPVPDCRAPIPLGAGYREGFEAGPGGWGVTTESMDVPASWEWGRPAGAQIARAAEGDHAFVTRLAGRYADREESLLVSPCFDASASAHDLLVELSWTTYVEAAVDRLSLEYSVDGGGSWQVATGERRIGWYEGGGWGEAMADWTRGAALLPGTAGQARVQVRLRFHSDGSVVPGDGAGVDDVSIRPASFDLAIGVAEAPSCGWVVATVTNVGGVPVTGFEIRGSVDGAPSSAPYDREIRYLDTEVLEIGGPLARSTTATVFTVGDENAANDTATLGHSSTPLGGGYASDFEANDGGLVVGGAPTSWEWGEPAGVLIRSAASGTRAWMTNLDGEYGAGERGYLLFPCYDLSAHSRDPQIALSRVFDTEACCDYGRVEVSIDGAPFAPLGSQTSGGTSWYTTGNGWAGSSGAGLWQAAQHPLTDTHGHRAVRIRIYFQSDGSAFGEGFGIDDLAIIP